MSWRARRTGSLACCKSPAPSHLFWGLSCWELRLEDRVRQGGPVVDVIKFYDEEKKSDIQDCTNRLLERFLLMNILLQEDFEDFVESQKVSVKTLRKRPILKRTYAN